MKLNNFKFSNLINKQNLFLFIVVLTGLYLRLSGIFDNNFAFTFDVGRDMLALWNIVHVHKFLLIGFTTGLPGVFYGPWWYYLLLIPYILSFGNPQGIALTMAIVGTITVIFGFLLGNKIGGRFLGISLASLIAISPPLISSQIWNPNFVPIFLVSSLLILHEIYLKEKTKIRYYFILGFILALIIDLEIVFGILLAIGLILSVLLIKNKKIQLKSIFAFIFGVIVIFSPRIIFEARHQFVMTSAFIKFFTTGEDSQQLSLLGTFINRLDFLFSQFNLTIALDNRSLGIVMALIILIIFIVFYKKISEISKQFIETSVIVILIFLIGLTFFHHAIWPHYIVGLPIIYLLLFSLIVNLIVQETRNYLAPSLIIILVFLLNFNPIHQVSNLNKPLWVGDASVYKNLLEVIDYVYKESGQNNFKYVVYTRAGADDTYQYLFKWYGQSKYHYLPNPDARLEYFILERDPQYPYDLDDWLKAREKNGQIIKEQKFKSGIVVQTRIH